MKKIDRLSKIGPLSIFSRDKSILLNEVDDHLSHSGKTAYIFTPNPEQYVQAEESQAYLSTLHQADWLIPDGVGLVAAAHFLAWFGKTQPIEQRIPGVELAQDLLNIAEHKKLKVLLIGGRDLGGRRVGKWQIIELPQEKLPISSRQAKKISTSQSLGLFWLPAYRQVSHPTPAEEQEVGSQIKKFQPDIIFVAFGAPAQELWAMARRPIFNQEGVKLVMVVGGAFDMLTGQLKRAPKWVQQLGLEWLFRLVQQPWRWHRQTRLFRFIWIIIKSLFIPTER
jgi:N-acetylglucosaminyldiphosphoundecaprenol N-acetyl-beta-D-mannosaminyltransferase